MPRRKSKVTRTAQRITDFVGGGDLAEYLGTQIARATVPREQRKYIQSKVSGKQAAASGARVALSVASLAGGTAIGVGARGLQAARAARIARTVPRSIKVAGQSTPIRVTRNVRATQVPRKRRPVRFSVRKTY